MSTSVRVPISASQAVHLNGLVMAKNAATLAEQQATKAVVLGVVSDADFARCTNLELTADAILCTIPALDAPQEPR